MGFRNHGNPSHHFATRAGARRLDTSPHSAVVPSSEELVPPPRRLVGVPPAGHLPITNIIAMWKLHVSAFV